MTQSRCISTKEKKSTLVLLILQHILILIQLVMAAIVFASKSWPRSSHFSRKTMTRPSPPIDYISVALCSSVFIYQHCNNDKEHQHHPLLMNVSPSSSARFDSARRQTCRLHPSFKITNIHVCEEWQCPFIAPIGK